MFILKHRLMTEAGAAGGEGAGAGGAAGSAGGAGAGAAGSAPAPWFAGFNPDLKGYVETKGFPADGKGIEALAESYRNLEKHFGVPAEQLLKLPKDETDKANWDKIYDRLGRPAKPEDYELKAAEGQDGDYAKFISTAMHELGITKKQAQTLAAKQNEYAAQRVGKDAAAYETKIATEDTALHTKWGQAYDKNVQIAQGSVAELGITAEAVNALEKVLGFAGVMEFFHNIGAKIGEDKFVSADAGGGGFGSVMSPEAANARIRAIATDPVLSAKYANGDAALRAEMDNLHKMLSQKA